MDLKQLFAKTVESADGCVKNVRVEEYDDPTPCSEWNLKQLLNHLVYELVWVPPLLEGQTIAEVGDKFEGDLLGDDPVDAWNKAAQAAVEAVNKADLNQQVHLSYGETSASHYIMEMANDVLIHGWDVGQAIHCSVMFDEQVAQNIYDALSPNIQAFRDGGFVGPEIEVPEDAPIQTKLLAIMGRRDRD